MKQLTIILLFSFSFFITKSQTSEFVNNNADTTKNNSIGINFSPYLVVLLGGEPDVMKLSALYKYYGKQFNFRLGLSSIIDNNTQNKTTIYYGDGSGQTVTSLTDGEVVLLTDSVTMQRYDLHNNYLFELNTGIEKAKKTKIGTWIISVNLNVGYFKKHESYLYREYGTSNLIDYTTEFTEFEFLAPNTSSPYFTGEYLKLGTYITTGFEWSLTKKAQCKCYYFA